MKTLCARYILIVEYSASSQLQQKHQYAVVTVVSLHAVIGKNNYALSVNEVCMRMVKLVLLIFNDVVGKYVCPTCHDAFFSSSENVINLHEILKRDGFLKFYQITVFFTPCFSGTTLLLWRTLLWGQIY